MKHLPSRCPFTGGCQDCDRSANVLLVECKPRDLRHPVLAFETMDEDALDEAIAMGVELAQLRALKEATLKAKQDLGLVRSWIGNVFPATPHRDQLCDLLRGIEENLGGDR